MKKNQDLSGWNNWDDFRRNDPQSTHIGFQIMIAYNQNQEVNIFFLGKKRPISAWVEVEKNQFKTKKSDFVTNCFPFA